MSARFERRGARASQERARVGGVGVGVIVWLNGPFGGGKTQTAYALHRRVSGSVVCDPEHVGLGCTG